MKPDAPSASARHAYEVWHASLPRDNELETPWHRMAIELLRPDSDLAGGVTLEIGCGRGGFASYLAEAVPGPKRILAADFSMRAVAIGMGGLSESAPNPIGWLTADILAIPLADEIADLVFSFETIEHVISSRKAVAELARVLRPGGRLFLSFPNYLNVLALYRGYLRLVGRRFQESGQPVNRFLLEPLVRLWVRRAGLEVISVTGRRHVLPLWRGRPAVVIESLDRVSILKRFAAQILIVARKPTGKYGD